MDEILATFFAIVLGMMYVPKIMHAADLARQEENDVATAQQLQQWASAVSNYVGQNLTTLSMNTTATTPITLSVATVQAANVGLPPNFSGKNLANQTWTAQVLQPTPGTLNVLVFGLGGSSIKDQELGMIARAAGGSGGFIPSNDTGAYPGGPANAYGTFGSWKLSTAGYSVGVGGSPATLLTFTNGALSSNYLYRNAIPGQPQLNEMNTDLGMSDNKIADVGQVIVAGGNGVQIGNSFYYGDTTNSAIRQNGTLYVQNQAGTAAAPINAGTATIYGDVNTYGNTYGTGSVIASGNIESGGYVILNGTANPGGACPGPQYIGVASTGPMLCEYVNGSFIWKAGLSSTVIVSGPPSFGESSSGPHSSVATCPTGTLLTGGGYQMANYSPNSSFNAYGNSPDMSMPMGNSWYIQPGGFPGYSEFIPYAVCAS